MSLRPYQADCERANLEDYGAGYRSLLNILPTGTGKTVIFSQVPKWFPRKRSLVLAHTEELVDQAAQKIAHWNPTLKVGIEMADRYCGPSHDVVVGSVATLGREGNQRLSRLDRNEFGALVVDESHHVVASTYQRIISHFGFGVKKDPQDRLLLGVTATSGRGDGKALNGTFDKVSYQYSMLQAIKDGWICPPIGFRIRTQTSLDDVHSLAGDLQQDELSTAVNTEQRNKLCVERWLEIGENRSTLAFTVDIQHARDLADMFRRQGVPAEAIWGDDPHRAEKLRRHRSGDITVLTNCGVLIEGYDDWRIGCIILARPTKSKLLFIQMIGRGLRLQDGTGNLNEAIERGLNLLKRDCLVLDFSDITTRHSLVTLPSIFGLPVHLALEGKPILEVVEEMEMLEAANPTVDFSTLDDLDNTGSYIEQVNLFDDNMVDPVIAELSQWRWTLTVKGNYVLALPNNDSVALSQNHLGHWEVHGNVSGVEFEDFNPELGDSVCVAERLIKQFWKGRRSTLVRKAGMPGDNFPASPQQITRIALLAGYANVPPPDTRGLSYFQAQLLINNLANGSTV